MTVKREHVAWDAHAAWEQWRHRRSKLARHERGVMLKVGERACRECEGAFAPANGRQRYCSGRCRTRGYRRRTATAERKALARMDSRAGDVVPTTL